MGSGLFSFIKLVNLLRAKLNPKDFDAAMALLQDVISSYTK